MSDDIEKIVVNVSEKQSQNSGSHVPVVLVTILIALYGLVRGVGIYEEATQKNSRSGKIASLKTHLLPSENHPPVEIANPKE